MEAKVVVRPKRKRFQKKVAMEVGDDDVEVEESITTIKTGLQGFISKGLDEEARGKLIEKIRADVEVVSKMANETALMIFHDLVTRMSDKRETITRINFRDYFAILKQNSKKDPPIGGYMDLRRKPEYGFVKWNGDDRLYENSYKGNLYNYQADAYESAFKNNIWMRAYARMRSFLRNYVEELTGERPPGAEMYKMLSYLFEDSEEKVAKKRKVNKEYELPQYLKKGLKEMFPKFDLKRGYFHKVKSEAISHLNFFYEMQCANELRGWKNFQLIPLNVAGLRHIQYDMQTFWYLLCGLGLCPKKPNPKEKPTGPPKRGKPWMEKVNVAYNELVWADWLKLKKKKEFAGTFSTNGIEVSVKYNVVRMPPSATTQVPDYDQYAAIDPGMRLLNAGVIVPPDNLRVKNNVKISNSSYQHENGHHARKRKLALFTKSIENDIREDREQMEDEEMLMHKGSLRVEEFVNFQLKWMAQKNKAYCQPRVARLKFDKFIRTNETLSKFVGELAGDAKLTKCFYGSMKVASDCPMKGYIRPPGRLLERKLKEHPRIHVKPTNEFRTTMLCSDCFVKLKVAKSPHRFATCPKCKKVWNRDINAAKNILQNGIHEMDGSAKHPAFDRTYDFGLQVDTLNVNDLSRSFNSQVNMEVDSE